MPRTWTGSCAATSSSRARSPIRLRGLGARAHARAVRGRGTAALRAGRADAARAARRRRHRRRMSAPRFRETGRSVGEALNPLVVAAQGHPQRTMLLAHRLWEQVAPKGTATLALGSGARGGARGASSRSSTPTGGASPRTSRRRSGGRRRTRLALPATACYQQLEVPKSSVRAALSQLPRDGRWSSSGTRSTRSSIHFSPSGSAGWPETGEA